MQTIVSVSPLDAFVEKLQKKHYKEFTMTRTGFTSGRGKYYEPRDLTIVEIYHCEDVINTDESFEIYVMKDKDGMLGYSIDASAEYDINEQNLLHWFITKVPVDKTIH